MIAEQLTFLEQIVPRDARYKAVARIDARSRFSQEFHLPAAVPRALYEATASGQNTYLSLCDYQRPRRAGETVFGFSGFGYDVDCHDSADPAAAAYRVYHHLKQNLFGSAAFPTPSLVEHTGRGLLVLVAFKRAPKQVLPLWLRLGEAFACALRAALPDYAHLDSTYADAARVVRVPDSYNTKAGRRTEVLEQDAAAPRLELHQLRDQYFTSWPDKPVRGAASPGKVIYSDAQVKLHADRLGDLARLCELRGYHLTGMRERVLFLYRYWTCFYIGPQAALEAALELNGRFTQPLPVREASRATHSAERAFERWREDKLKGYNYRNGTLIELLRITPEEQRQLTTIISKEEKAARRADKTQWGNKKRDTLRAIERDARDDAIRQAHANGLSHRQIAQELHCGHSTIATALRTAPQARQTSLPMSL